MKHLQQKRALWVKRIGLLVGGGFLLSTGLSYFLRHQPRLPVESKTVRVSSPGANIQQQVKLPAADLIVIPPKGAASLSTRSSDAIAWLERLAARSPVEAISWALTEGDPLRRAELVQAVLRGWASIDCQAAANWAQKQTYAEMGQAMSAVFNGANNSPEKAIQLALSLTVADPAHAKDYGSYLIFSLASVGEFSRAAEYAANSQPQCQAQLLIIAYDRWSRQEPELAARAALRLPDPSAQRAAFQAALGGWAQSNPEQLTTVAEKFPEGDDRRLALTIGLRSWIEKNPGAAAEWISHSKFTPEMEAALED